MTQHKIIQPKIIYLCIWVDKIMIQPKIIGYIYIGYRTLYGNILNYRIAKYSVSEIYIQATSPHKLHNDHRGLALT